MLGEFTFDPPKHPTKNTDPRGTLETLKGVAEFKQYEDGSFEYEGNTDVWWDEQKTVSKERRRHGRDVQLVKLVDADGDEWWAERIEVKVEHEHSA